MNRGGLELSRDTQTCLLLYDWPGNVRQLANEIRSFVAMAEPDDTITPYQLSPEVRACAERPGRARAPDRPAAVVGGRAVGARDDPPGDPESGRPCGHDRKAARSVPEGALPEAPPPGHRRRGSQLTGGGESPAVHRDTSQATPRPASARRDERNAGSM